MVALKRACCWVVGCGGMGSLTSESVEGAPLPLEGIDDVHGGDGLPLGVLGVGDGITDDVLKENLEDTTGLFVDESGDTFHTTSSRQTTDSGLGDSLDVIPQHLPVSLGASFAQALSPLPSPMSVSTHNLAITHNFYLIAILNLPAATKMEFHF